MNKQQKKRLSSAILTLPEQYHSFVEMEDVPHRKLKGYDLTGMEGTIMLLYYKNSTSEAVRKLDHDISILTKLRNALS